MKENKLNLMFNLFLCFKKRLKEEGSQQTIKCSQLRMFVPDWKIRLVDAMLTEDIFKLIESVPSLKVKLGSERIDDVFDPEFAINRVVMYYRSKGYSYEWIKIWLTSIVIDLNLQMFWKNVEL